MPSGTVELAVLDTSIYIERVELPHRRMTVDGEVAKVLDELRRREDRRTDRSTESGLVDECAQVILIRQLACRVVRIEPCHGLLESAPGVEAGAARVGVDKRFGLRSRLEERSPLALEELEVGGQREASLFIRLSSSAKAEITESNCSGSPRYMSRIAL